ncbi:MAG: YraN family protein [Ignavibacteriota bacterium]|nr:YraN family protein [Ignavibacteriota bacterium]MCO6447055.1 YraN family protein [Ignavibacterium album]MCZ2267869.1 YraN family protein [Ignavibacteriales bacterium]HMN16706.1 YraN family protein [Ignavibacteriaceae bacterium]QKK00095.1 MAG: YraN family protein [Ignavibacteriota bacterium]
MTEINKKDFGKDGEEIAAKYLLKKGFEILKRNYRFSHGEIDIIAKDGDTLVFVEVKTRKNLEYGEPEYAITKKKIQQLKKIAELYLFDKQIEEADCRFDVIAIILGSENNPQITHYENAFM